jgi:predicted RNA-binding Zn-ribbon protein involved in translation (DUF1610 family)
MNSHGYIPPEARCWTCGYSLRGLPECICPECGRAFDPADSGSFDTRPPGARRRKWIQRSAAIACVLLIAIGLAPRGLFRGEVSFTCADCGETVTITRVEPRPPGWIPFRYPGFDWRRATPPTQPRTAECQQVFNVAVKSDLFCGGRVGGSGAWKGDVKIRVNHRPLDFDSAPTVLKDLVARSNTGIQIGP